MGSDWIEKRNTQRDVKSALHLVKAELQTNRETILGGKQRVEREIRAAQFLLRNKDSLLVVSKDSLEYYSNMPFQTSFITFTTDALELMKSSALFPQIKDRQLGLSIIQAYASIKSADVLYTTYQTLKKNGMTAWMQTGSEAYLCPETFFRFVMGPLVGHRRRI